MGVTLNICIFAISGYGYRLYFLQYLRTDFTEFKFYPLKYLAPLVYNILILKIRRLIFYIRLLTNSAPNNVLITVFKIYKHQYYYY